MQSNSWLLRRPGTRRRVRLYCFSYAGGSALNFLPWQTGLDPAIEICAVQLPGRGGRLHESPYRSMSALIEALAPVIARHSELPFAFFGHSLGALVAFEMARHCERRGLPMPMHLFVSGCQAPQYRNSSRRVHELDDDALIDVLKEYNGTPAEILTNRELVTLLLPTIRADFSLAENYQYSAGPLLKIPITAMAGKQDDHSCAQQADGWQRETTNRCRVIWFEGDHFFIHSERDMILDCLNAELTEQLSARYSFRSCPEPT